MRGFFYANMSFRYHSDLTVAILLRKIVPRGRTPATTAGTPTTRKPMLLPRQFFHLV